MGETPSDAELLEDRRRLGARIRRLREARGWSQDVFAHLTALNRSYPHKIETAQVDVRYSTLVRIARALGMTVAEVVAVGEEE